VRGTISDGVGSIEPVAQTELEVREPASALAQGSLEPDVRRSDRLIVIRPAPRWPHLDVRELWHYRELAGTFVWRDIKVRYKQTFIGVGWAFIQPFLSTVVFTLVLGKFAGFPHPGVHAVPVYVLSGLIVWQYFSSATVLSSSSIIGNINLVTKVYFPRVLIPFASVLVPFVDFLIACLVLAGATLVYGEPVDGPFWFAPFFLLLAVVTAVGAGLLLSTVNVRYRDVPYAIPYLLQIGMWISTVFVPVSSLSPRQQWIYALSPMNLAIEGFRWSLYDSPAPELGHALVSVASVTVLFLGGLWFFRRSEPRFADMI
jgi:lipopolysaccharide transport system permease protein